MSEKILVTGGAGFIGSEFVRQAFGQKKKVIVIDKMTYAGDLTRLKAIGTKVHFYQADIAHEERLNRIFAKEKPDVVVHCAAESHVDRSIVNVDPFIFSNVIGTSCLIKASLTYRVKKFIHVSTDEVYGVRLTGQFKEDEKLNPQNPYAATKAASDHLVSAAVNTHGLPAIIVRPCNNYGPWQHPEKFIPVVIAQALINKLIPIYGQGSQIREWLHVCDCVRALMCIIEKGDIGEIYNIGSNDEFDNLTTARMILKIMDKPERLLKFVADRPGHDFRYKIDSAKIKRLGWKPVLTFQEGLTVSTLWYKSHFEWLKKKLSPPA